MSTETPAKRVFYTIALYRRSARGFERTLPEDTPALPFVQWHPRYAEDWEIAASDQRHGMYELRAWGVSTQEFVWVIAEGHAPQHIEVETDTGETSPPSRDS